MTRSTLLALVAAASLSACASNAQPTLTITPPPMRAAELIAETSAPTKRVAFTSASPIPEQVMAFAPQEKRTRPVAPIARVEAANRAALKEPEGHGYVNAVQIYPFIEGTLYSLYAAPERVSDIALEPGETLASVAAGDTVRWIVGDTTSGAGATRQTHILVKPSAPGLKTNLIITTDRRTYHLQMESTDRTYMAALSWTYPQDELLAIRRASEAAASQAPIARGLDIERLDFDYKISGDMPSWRPTRVFDDGRQVFIAFPDDIGVGEAPPLFVSGPKGETQLVNYRMRGNYYIVDRLFDAAELRLGIKPQSVVRIERKTANKPKRRGKSS